MENILEVCEAFEKGQNDFYKDFKLKDNPYPKDKKESRNAWYSGWTLSFNLSYNDELEYVCDLF